MVPGDETRSDEDAGAPSDGGPASRPLTVDDSVDSFETITYDASTGAYHARYDPAVDSVSAAVVATVAAAASETTTGLPSLYGSVDPDALDILVSPDAWEGDSAITQLEFVYVTHRVLVEAPGQITVFPNATDVPTP